MKKYDWYDGAKDLIKSLRDVGMNDWAQKLDDTIIYGTSGSEIMGLLNLELIKMKKEAKPLPVDILRKTNKLIHELSPDKIKGVVFAISVLALFVVLVLFGKTIGWKWSIMLGTIILVVCIELLITRFPKLRYRR
jgi:hypothetical protein